MPQQRAEHREHESGQHEQQIAKHAVGTDMTDQLGPDHHETADDGDRPQPARERNPLAEKHRGKQQAAERRAGRLDDAAMAERHEQESGIADERHDRPAQHHQHQSAAPSDAAEIADAGAKHDRQEHEAPTTGSGASADPRGVNPTFSPCRVATKPSAQNSAAPAPHATPSRAALASDFRVGAIRRRRSARSSRTLRLARTTVQPTPMQG